MRLSEKTIELNICAQISKNLTQQVLWFGLTQAQEAQSGFDAATRLNGRILLFQFKASNVTMKGSGARRFLLEHDQLQRLITKVNGVNRSVFYVFPMIGDTLELQTNGGDFYNNSWLLDVSTLQDPFPPPTSNIPPFGLRKSGKHYADVIPPAVTIHSDPITAKIESLNKLVKSNFQDSKGLNSLLINNKKTNAKKLDYLVQLKGNFKMAVIFDSK